MRIEITLNCGFSPQRARKESMWFDDVKRTRDVAYDSVGEVYWPPCIKREIEFEIEIIWFYKILGSLPGSKKIPR
jgi:hypothetical protein